MSWTTIAAIYFVIWWVTLFAVLPFGVRSQHETGEMAPGTDPGAPVVPNIWAKLGWTTLIASVLFALFYGVYTSGIVSLDDLATLWGLLK
jgi:predicted secreted protein